MCLMNLSYAFPPFIGYILDIYEYEFKVAAMAGNIFNFSGIAGALFSGVIMAKWEKFKRATYMVLFLTLGLLIMLYASIVVKNVAFLYTSFALTGFVGISIYGFVYEMLVEVGSPMTEAFVGGMVNLAANMGSFIFVVIFTEILKPRNETSVMIIFIILCITMIIAIVLMRFVKF